MNTNEDNLEYAVSQAVDGTLCDLDRRTLGARLDADDARQLAADHARLTALLRLNAPRPPVDFDGFSAAFSEALAAEPAYAPPTLVMRTTWLRRVAMVAAIVLTGLAAWPLLPHRTPTAQAPAARGPILVKGPAAPTTATPPVTQIAVGPSREMVEKGYQYGLSTRPENPGKPRVVISSSMDPSSELRPY